MPVGKLGQLGEGLASQRYLANPKMTDITHPCNGPVPQIL